MNDDRPKRDSMSIEEATVSNWAAAGFKDTESGVWMKLEVRHGATHVYARVQG